MKKTDYKNEKIIIRDISSEGDGISSLSAGKTVFVPGLLPGEEAEISITEENSSYCIGKVLKMLKYSPFRLKPPCPVFEECGGCSLQHISYKGQLQIKKDRVTSCLQRIGGFDGITVEDCLPSPHILTYRNKLAFPVRTENGRLITGCFKPRSHEIVSTDNCLLHSKKMMDCVKKMFSFLKEENISGYDEKTQKGCVRHIIVRESSNGELLAGFVVNDKNFPCKKATDSLTSVADTLVVNYNSSYTNLILGSETTVLTGTGKITETILGKNFKVSPETFLQVNHAQAENLYSVALQYSDIKPTDTVADLYCGIGTISLCAAVNAKKVYGIEIVPESIRNAKENAEENGIDNVEFICADAAEGFKRVLETSEHINCLILDPPRKGLSEEACSAVISASAERIVYVSCDPATLARDIKKICAEGYSVLKVQPVDMFPMTGHVETVALLGRKQVEYRVEFDVDVTDLKKPTRKRATYPEIKEYVKERFGLNVSSLNIAQVKDKCGLGKRENYYKGKDGHRVPNCPEEKEKAIIETFKHFGMV